MATTVTMPALSPTMEEGRLAKWHVAEGDKVASGDLLAEIETDKAMMELEAADEGVVAKLLVAEGSEGVKVNAAIALLAGDGEDPAAIVEPVSGVAAPEPADAGPGVRPGAPGPVSRFPAPAREPKGTPRLRASPLARRLASEAGIDLQRLSGTGPEGRIVKRDVEAARPALVAGPAPPAAPAPEGLDTRVYSPDSYALKPLDGMSRAVAERLTASATRIPQFPLTRDIPIDGLLRARANINRAAPEGVKISVNDMLIKASAVALKRVPECNASFVGDAIAYHKRACVSVAVAIQGGGLMTPVVFDADRLGLAEISRRVKDLASRAQERRLKPHEYLGGTFSLSNLGMFGVKAFGSIINPPEGMILSVGTGRREVAIDDAGQFVAVTVMSVTLTCDHRVMGGAEAARWLQAFSGLVADPASMLL